MKLSNENVALFYRLYHPLLVYVNKKNVLINGLDSPEDFIKFPITEINKLRERLYEKPDLINQFISENPLKFSEDELNLISSWNSFVKGKFIILRCLKKHTIFLDSNNPVKAYGVIALNSTFEEMVGHALPIMVEAVLLLFDDKIIYDSIFIPYHISFGSGIRRNLNDTYEEAKNRFGIITSLPFLQKGEEKDIDKLKFYLKNIDNRIKYREEIKELINKDRNLLVYYHKDTSRKNVSKQRRILYEIGLKKGWFAMLEGTIIASGKNKEELERNMSNIVPEQNKDFVFVFELAGGK